MSKMHVKTGDTVIVISGEYANGKEPAIGKVIGVSPKEGKVMVEGVEKRIYFEPHSNLWFSVKSYEG